MHRRDHRFRFHFSQTECFSALVNPLTAVHSDHVVRPCSHNGSNMFSTPWSAPITPSSWPPRADSMGLGQTSVVVHVAHFWLNNINTRRTPCRDHCCDVVVTSWIVLRAIKCSREAILIFWKPRVACLKRCYEFVRAFWAWPVLTGLVSGRYLDKVVRYVP